MLDPRDIDHMEDRVFAAADDKRSLLKFYTPKQKSNYFTIAYAEDVPKLLNEIERLRALVGATQQGTKK